MSEPTQTPQQSREQARQTNADNYRELGQHCTEVHRRQIREHKEKIRELISSRPHQATDT